MKLYLKTLVLFGLLLSCNKGKTEKRKENQSNNLKIDSSLAKAIDVYIKYKPIEINYGEKLTQYYEKGFSHPSYHIYFDKKGKDTIFSITIFPELHAFELEEFEGSTEDEKVVFRIFPKGFFTYKKKNPIIVFDKKSIANKFYNREILHSIPDSLITTSIDDIRDYKPYLWKYRIKNGEITEKITKKEE